MIYVVKMRGHKPVKIGYTEDLDRRLQSLQGGCPFPIELVGTMQGGRACEKMLHERYSPYRCADGGKEWFRLPEQELRDLQRRLI